MSGTTSSLTRRAVCASALAFAAAHSLAKAPPRDISSAQDFDELWETMRDNYAFFFEKATNWEKVRTMYRPILAATEDEQTYKRLLIRVMDEVYDAHTHFRSTDPGLPNAPLWDMLLEDTPAGVRVKAVRDIGAAADAGISIGSTILTMEGKPFEAAVADRIPRCLRRPDPEARAYALNAAIAGLRDQPRRIGLRSPDGQVRNLVLPKKTMPNRDPISWRKLDDGIGYIAITTFGDYDSPKVFDRALEELKDAPGLIIDVRLNGGGDTAVARPIMGRFISERRPYAHMRRRSGKGVALTDPWIEYVDPRGPFTYTRPVVVLCHHWSGSMAEGFPMGMRGIGRATVVGTPMMRLGAAVFGLNLDRSGFQLQYSAEPVYDVQDRPRWHFQPDVDVPDGQDILAAGIAELKRQIGRARP
jgi:carboxyl-terminal processing protease